MIDLTPRLNPARSGAYLHAGIVARLTGQPVNIYAAPPGSKSSITTYDWQSGYNVWYVRLASEPAPENSQLIETINPPEDKVKHEDKDKTP